MDTHYTVMDLKTQQPYEFRVVAQNAVGPSEHSLPSMAATPRDPAGKLAITYIAIAYNLHSESNSITLLCNNIHNIYKNNTQRLRFKPQWKQTVAEFSRWYCQSNWGRYTARTLRAGMSWQIFCSCPFSLSSRSNLNVYCRLVSLYSERRQIWEACQD